MRTWRRNEGIKRALKIIHLWDATNDLTSIADHSYNHFFLNSFNDGEGWARSLISTRCPCSSWCCGNPRRHWKKKKKIALTLQEQKMDISSKEQVENL